MEVATTVWLSYLVDSYLSSFMETHFLVAEMASELASCPEALETREVVTLHFLRCSETFPVILSLALPKPRTLGTSLEDSEL